MLLFPFSLQLADQEKNPTQSTDKVSEQHSSNCPEACKSCEQFVAKALKFLISQQQEDGRWKRERASTSLNLVNTSLCGLALIASGSTLDEGIYKQELQKAVKYVIDTSRKELKGRLTQFNMCDTTYIVTFLAHVYRINKSDELGKYLEEILGLMLKEQGEDGGWNYRRTGASQSKIKGYYQEKGSHVFLTNDFAITLLLLKEVGINVEKSVFDKIRGLYDTDGARMKEGAFKYATGEAPQNADLRCSSGRTVVASWVMELMGMKETKALQQIKIYAEKNIKDIDLSNHGPTYHIYKCGLACYYSSDKSMWKQFWSNYRDVISSSQKDDGSVVVKPRKESLAPFDDKAGGSIYTTPQYVILLQLNKGRLLFDSLKPLSSKEKE